MKEEYEALCLPHIPITGKLFGDELQSQLNSIKVSLATLRPVLLVAAFTRNLAITTGQREKAKGKRNNITARKNSGRKRSRNCKLFIDRFTSPCRVDLGNFVSVIPALANYFTLRADCYKAGQLIDYVDNWKLNTSDQEILSTVQDLRIEFQSIPIQKEAPSLCVKQSEMDVISTEIEKRLQKGVIVATRHGKGKFISPIFIRPKKDGSFQPQSQGPRSHRKPEFSQRSAKKQNT